MLIFKRIANCLSVELLQEIVIVQKAFLLTSMVREIYSENKYQASKTITEDEKGIWNPSSIT